MVSVPYPIQYISNLNKHTDIRKSSADMRHSTQLVKVYCEHEAFLLLFHL